MIAQLADVGHELRMDGDTAVTRLDMGPPDGQPDSKSGSQQYTP